MTLRLSNSVQKPPSYEEATHPRNTGFVDQFSDDYLQAGLVANDWTPRPNRISHLTTLHCTQALPGMPRTANTHNPMSLGTNWS